MQQLELRRKSQAWLPGCLVARPVSGSQARFRLPVPAPFLGLREEPLEVSVVRPAAAAAFRRTIGRVSAI